MTKKLPDEEQAAAFGTSPKGSSCEIPVVGDDALCDLIRPIIEKATGQNVHPNHVALRIVEEVRPFLRERMKKCAATISTDPPMDCNWPFCGCDPKANEVMETLMESGYELVDPFRKDDTLVPQAMEPDEAYGYASRLFRLLAPQCEPLPTTLGVLTQLDNYIAGLRNPKPVSVAVSLEKCAKALHDAGCGEWQMVWPHPSYSKYVKAVLDAAGVKYVQD